MPGGVMIEYPGQQLKRFFRFSTRRWIGLR